MRTSFFSALVRPALLFGLAAFAACSAADEGEGVSAGEAAGGEQIAIGAALAAACTGKAPAPPGDVQVTLDVGGVARRAFVHVPPGYDPGTATPLILNFHGLFSNGAQQQALTRLDAIADAKRLLVAYPEGIEGSFNAGLCCGAATFGQFDDVGFTRALLDRLGADFCVDDRRVYSTGMSNGGFFSHRLACEMSDRIAAVAPVAGTLGVLDPNACRPPRPVPILQFHGTADPVVPFNGNPLLLMRSVTETVGHWASRDSCLGPPSLAYLKGDAACVHWAPFCAGGSDVVACVIDGGGHTWPGGLPLPLLGKTSTDLDASAAMVDFFLAHPMP
jgi:polyhydroxybutyrate depolymerase